MRRCHFSILMALAILMISCNKDEDEADPVQTSIRANLTVPDEEGVPATVTWSLPSVSAVRQSGNIIITGYNLAHGEILTLRVPDNGAGYYTNTGSNNDLGYASWRSHSDSITWYSNIFPEGTLHDLVVDITSIDDEFLNGTFYTVVYNPDDAETDAVFQNGSMINIPIVLDDGLADVITENSISFRVDGINFNPQSFEVIRDDDNQEFLLEATNASDAKLKIRIPSTAFASDEFEVGSGQNEIEVSFQSPPFPAYPGLNGTVTVETHNLGAETMSGSFEFQVGEFGTPNHTISQGSFELVY